MKDTPKIKRTIPHVLKAISMSNDILETTKYENQLACMLASPIMFLGAIVYFIFCYLILHEDFVSTLSNSLTFLGLAISFEAAMRIRMNIELQTYIISILYSSLFIFITLSFFNTIGPMIWMAACIMIVLAMMRVKKIMAIIIGTAIILSCIYAWFNTPNFQFTPSHSYLIIQSLLIGVFIGLLNITHKVSTDRYLKLLNQFREEVDQKNDITALYEEIAATEEELRQQNEQLTLYAEEIRRSDEKLYDLSYYDILTKLPNRKLFTEQLNLLIEKSKEQRTVFYVVSIDVDSFKRINDTLGHHMGDMFIRSAADRIEKCSHEGDLFGRIGGDEFALIINRGLNKKEIFQEIETIRNNFSEIFKIEGEEIISTASFGIAAYPYDGSDASELLKSASMSMYRAKELGKNNVQFFKKSMRDQIIQKVKMENRLVSALEKQEFSLVFQPQYWVNSKKIRGFEALIRWNSPEFGALSPMEFIPLAEEMGLIIPLGQWILKRACYRFKKLQEQYGPDAFISVNISAIQINDSNFIEVVKSILKETGLDSKCLELEITETVFIKSFNKAILLLKELKELGIRIALDDFGTGYSSLSYLKLLPIDTLKIDKSFISDLSTDTSQVQIVGDIISLGHNLGVSVIAEGVEYDHQLQYLKDHSCDYVQGFLLGKPLDEEALM